MSRRSPHRAATYLGVALLLTAIAVLSASVYAQQTVRDQLMAQRVLLPSNDIITAERRLGTLTDADVAALRPFAGQMMATGPQAKVYADHYIDAQLRAAAESAKVPAELATIDGLSKLTAQRIQSLRDELAALPKNSDLTDQELAVLINAEFNNPYSRFQNARDAARYEQLRNDTFIPGHAVRGVLLNAYGWWLLGSMGIIAGWALAIAGTALLFTAGGWHARLRTVLQDRLSAPDRDPA